jgi:hypothetical protein
VSVPFRQDLPEDPVGTGGQEWELERQRSWIARIDQKRAGYSAAFTVDESGRPELRRELFAEPEPDHARRVDEG